MEWRHASHSFPCNHDTSEDFDIIFIIDSGRWMKRSLNGLRLAIKKLLDKYYDKQDIFRLGAVFFTDHSKKNSGGLDESFPVALYPLDQQL